MYAFVLSDFIFPITLSLLIYFYLKRESYDFKFCLLCSLSVIMIPFMASLLPFLAKEGTALTGPLNYQLFFSRTPHPQISYIFLLGSIFAFTEFLKSRRLRKIDFLLPPIIGVSLYASLHVSSTILVAILLLTPWYFKHLSRRKTIYFFAIVLIFLIPHMANYFFQQKHLFNSDFINRTSFPVHMLFPTQLRYVAIAIGLITIGKKKIHITVISLFILAAALLIDGHQLIGFGDLEADHWVSRVLAPLSTMAIFIIFYHIYSFFIKDKSGLIWISLMLIVLLFGAYTQFKWTIKNRKELRIDNASYELIKQIENNTDSNDVIGSLDTPTIDLITGLTGRDTYIAPGDRTLAPADEQIERICTLLILSKSKKNLNIYSAANFILGYQSLNPASVNDALNKIRDCFKDNNIAPYKLDYIVLKEDSNFVLQRIKK